MRLIRVTDATDRRSGTTTRCCSKTMIHSQQPTSTSGKISQGAHALHRRTVARAQAG
eukprot:m.134433 g.134433  ORF g.134433 m.134433 type:complete len:57 (+) comp9869_c0_seq2:8723-8893(+)